LGVGVLGERFRVKDLWSRFTISATPDRAASMVDTSREWRSRNPTIECGAWDFRLRAQGLGFRVQSLGFRV